MMAGYRLLMLTTMLIMIMMVMSSDASSYAFLNFLFLKLKNCYNLATPAALAQSISTRLMQYIKCDNVIFCKNNCYYTSAKIRLLCHTVRLEGCMNKFQY